ncbi:hypothetical protein [Streptomyces sp. YKOK-I1]
MVGDARVVGLGEATHGSPAFFALKDRVFRHLAEEFQRDHRRRR